MIGFPSNIDPKEMKGIRSYLERRGFEIVEER